MAFTTKTADPAKPGKAAAGCFLFFALFWSGITLTFDGVIGRGAFRQIQATGFPTAPGHVTQSGIVSQRDRKGRVTYTPNIVYTYQVAGKAYQGDRYRYGLWTSGSSTARQIVGAFPVGRAIDVFYSPSDPANSVLKTGLEGNDLFMAMFLTPFNLIMLGMWTIVGRMIYRRADAVPAGGAKIVDDGFTTRIRLSRISPLAVGAASLGGLAFLGIFVALIAAGVDPPLQTMYAIWIVILIVALAAWFASWRRIVRPENDLVIDEGGRRVTLPVSFGRTDSLVVPLDKAIAIDIQTIARPGAKGSTYYCYAPTLVFSDHDGMERREKLAEWTNAADAAALAAWLRERMRLPAAGEDADTNPKR